MRLLFEDETRLGTLLPTSFAFPNPEIRLRSLGTHTWIEFGDSEFIARLLYGLITGFEQNFATVKSFRVTSD